MRSNPFMHIYSDLSEWVWISLNIFTVGAFHNSYFLHFEWICLSVFALLQLAFCDSYLPCPNAFKYIHGLCQCVWIIYASLQCFLCDCVWNSSNLFAKIFVGFHKSYLLYCVWMRSGLFVLVYNALHDSYSQCVHSRDTKHTCSFFSYWFSISTST